MAMVLHILLQPYYEKKTYCIGQLYLAGNEAVYFGILINEIKSMY